MRPVAVSALTAAAASHGDGVCAVGVVFTTIESVEGVGATAVEGQIGELRALTAAPPLGFPPRDSTVNEHG